MCKLVLFGLLALLALALGVEHASAQYQTFGTHGVV